MQRRRLCVALALAMTLSGPLASAWAAGSENGAGSWLSPPGPWSWLAAVLFSPSTVQGNCGDPDGQCLGSAAQISSDPNGQTASESDRGWLIDPNG